MSDDDINRIWSVLDQVAIGVAEIRASLAERCSIRGKELEDMKAQLKAQDARLDVVEKANAKWMGIAAIVGGIAAVLGQGIISLVIKFWPWAPK